MYALFFAALTWAAPLKVVTLGNVRVTFAIGDVTKQDLPAIAASHPPNRVVTRGGVAGAVVRAGAASSVDAFGLIMERAGTLPYGSVHPMPIAPGSQLRARVLLNVIELDPLVPLRFLRVAELDASPYPFTTAERTSYRRLLTVWEKSAAGQVSNEHFVHVRHPFQKAREDLLRPHEATLRFRYVTKGVTNLLHALTDLQLGGVSVGTLGNGRSGSLDTRRSIEAVLAGVDAFTRARPEHPELELRYVVGGNDLVSTRRHVLAWIEAALADGHFLKTAGEVGIEGTDWSEARAEFQAREGEAVVTPPTPLHLRAFDFCGRVLSRVERAIKDRLTR